MSAPTFAWAIEQGEKLGLQPSERLVLIVLADCYNGASQTAWPLLATITGRTGLSERGVRDAITQLEAGGLIERERRGKSWLYYLQRKSNGAVPSEPGTPALSAGIKRPRKVKTPAPHAGELSTTPALSAGIAPKTPALSAGIAPKTPALSAKTPAVSAGRTLKNPQEGTAAIAAAAPEARSAALIELAERVTGCSPERARSFLGALLKAAGDNRELVRAKLEACEALRPINPPAWLMAAVRAPTPKAAGARTYRNGTFTVIERDLAKREAGGWSPPEWAKGLINVG